jgi:signal-transduction protein with cAMP-binding, CBS, and nucleotidyltransferase domain
MEKIEFLRKMPIFEKWSNSNLNILLYYCEEKSFPKNTVLFKEDDPSLHVFFIREGEVEVINKIKNYLQERKQKQQGFISVIKEGGARGERRGGSGKLG